MTYEHHKTCPGCFKAELKDGRCDACGYSVNDRKNLLALPEHTILAGKYVIGKVIGIGGFGITYLALDLTLNKLSAIKEYLPRDIAGREAGSKTIKAHTEKEEELYRYGLEKFIEEARTLARFDHYNIVRVREVFQENGTCYIVMDYYEGMTLSEYMKARGGRLTEEETIDIMMPIMDGLKVVHREGILHRDIKPDNIYITNEGRGILIDFGSARIAMGERSRSMSVVLTPGYAPYEQYQSKGEQGVWTDIYALGATMYHMLTGEAPPDAVERRDRDEIIPLKRKNPSISENTNRAVMKALAVYHRGRQKSVQELQDMLFAKAVNTIGEKTVGFEKNIDNLKPVETISKAYYDAGFWRRTGAFIIDLILVSTAIYFLVLIDEKILQGSSSNIRTFFSILVMLMPLFYFVYMEGPRWSATIGKMIFRISVVTTYEKKLSYGRSIVRNIVKAFFFTGFFILQILLVKEKINYLIINLFNMLLIGLWIHGPKLFGFTNRKQTIHDLISKTLVVKR